MNGALAKAIEELDIPVDPDALVEVLWLSDRLAAKVSQAVGAVDSAKLWDLSGATSMRAFLKDKAGLTGATDNGYGQEAHPAPRHRPGVAYW